MGFPEGGSSLKCFLVRDAHAIRTRLIAGAGFEPATSGVTQGDSEYYRTLRETAESLVVTRCSLSRTIPILPDLYRLMPPDSGG